MKPNSEIPHNMELFLKMGWGMMVVVNKRSTVVNTSFVF